MYIHFRILLEYEDLLYDNTTRAYLYILVVFLKVSYLRANLNP